MPQRQKTDPGALVRPTWREYQNRLKRTAYKERFAKKSLKLFFLSLMVIVVFYSIMALMGGKSFLETPADGSAPSDAKKIIEKKDVRALLGDDILNNIANKNFECVSNHTVFHIETSIDTALQDFLQQKAEKSIAKDIGIVCMDPYTGKILAMVGLDRTDTSVNPCVSSRFPAASIFKIVTAAAAIEQCGFNLNSKFSYNGRKHTLYKFQLKERQNKFTNHITLKDSFAQSINPVFGKIGSLYLGKDNLETYALIFGFNGVIDFEVKLIPSVFSISNDPYQWAEIASGFNHKTNMTPLHGALMASVVINQGKLVEPTIVDQITNEKKQVIYHGETVTIRQVIAPATAKAIWRLMEETVNKGTFRKTFKGYKNDPTLSKLDIGGKSGTIDSPSNDVRYDWFVGFAKEKDGRQKMAVAAIVTHQRYIGKRAGDFARMAMEKYFGNYFAFK